VLEYWVSLGFATVPGALICRITVEERMMTEALGASYQRYRQRKARVAPGLWWRSADQR